MIYDPFAFDLLGLPKPAKAPAALRVLGDGSLTDAQLLLAQQAFYRFCETARLSTVPNPVEVGRLSDGTPYKIIDVTGNRVMLVWPQGDEADQERFVAWTSFVDTPFLPIWDRPVIDTDTDSDILGPYPVMPEVWPPANVQLVEDLGWFGRRSTSLVAVEYGGGTPRPSINVWAWRKSRLRLTVGTYTYSPGSSPGSSPSASYSHQNFDGTISVAGADTEYGSEKLNVTYSDFVRLTNTAADDNSVADGTNLIDLDGEVWRRNSPGTGNYGLGDPALPDKLLRWCHMASGTVTGYAHTISGYAPRVDNPGGPSVYYAVDEDGPSELTYGGAILVEVNPGHTLEYAAHVDWSRAAVDAYDAAQAAASAYNAAANAEYQARYDAAVAAYNAEVDAWNARKALLDSGGGNILPARVAARSAQVNALRDYIAGGVGDWHLTASLLAFPYNVNYKTAVTGNPSGATLMDTAPVQSGTGRFVVGRQIAGGVRMTESPPSVIDLPAPFDDAGVAAYRLGDKFLPTPELFGWVVNGSFNMVFRPGGDHTHEARDLGGLAFSGLPGYSAEDRPTRSNDPGLVVNSDAFVPPGSEFWFVLFEYEVEDVYTKQSIWTPCPNMVLSDSIVFKGTGAGAPYQSLTQTGEEKPATIKVRPWKVMTQKRLAWNSWGAPETMDARAIDASFLAELPYASLAEKPDSAPTAVVIAKNLPAISMPSAAQTTEFRPGAGYLWEGDHSALAAAIAQPWQTSDMGVALAPKEQFVAMALRLCKLASV